MPTESSPIASSSQPPWRSPHIDVWSSACALSLNSKRHGAEEQARGQRSFLLGSSHQRSSFSVPSASVIFRQQFQESFVLAVNKCIHNYNYDKCKRNVVFIFTDFGSSFSGVFVLIDPAESVSPRRTISLSEESTNRTKGRVWLPLAVLAMSIGCRVTRNLSRQDAIHND